MEKQNNIEVPAKKQEVAEEPPKKREELEKKKSPEQEIDEIDREISEIEELMEKEKKELAESRVKLGIPEAGEESVGIKSCREKINSLTARKIALEKSAGVVDKNKSGEEDKTEKKETEAEKIKPQEFNDFITRTKELVSFLKKRDSQRLNSLIEDPGKIVGAISALEASLSSQTPDTEGAGRAIGRIAEAISELGEKQNKGSVNENPESLKELAFRLINIDKERQALSGRIMKKENTPDILSSLSRINSAVENKKSAISGKLKFLEQYFRR